MKDTAINIVKRLREARHTAYFNGGCGRDMVRGVEPERGQFAFFIMVRRQCDTFRAADYLAGAFVGTDAVAGKVIAWLTGGAAVGGGEFVADYTGGGLGWAITSLTNVFARLVQIVKTSGGSLQNAYCLPAS